jgi:hypothetical protein
VKFGEGSVLDNLRAIAVELYLVGASRVSDRRVIPSNSIVEYKKPRRSLPKSSAETTRPSGWHYPRVVVSLPRRGQPGVKFDLRPAQSPFRWIAALIHEDPRVAPPRVFVLLPEG